MKKTLSTIQKEFDEKISKKVMKIRDIEIIPLIDEIKSFYEKSLRELLEQVVPEKKETKIINTTASSDYPPNVSVQTLVGTWNDCRQEVLDRIKTILEN